MNIVEKIKKMKDLDINPKGGASKEQIERAEKRLNLKFSEEYKEYLKEFGAISFFGNEWSGLNIDGYFNVVNMTEDEKALNESFPKKHFVIENIGVDSIFIISNEDGKIYSIQYDKIEFLCNSLSEYLDICLKRN
ncbi:SMI1/KNR4 family protein [Fusobacterium polymorphum]|jgi:hypothetical protein|uniref:SMI1/KNR4 family protein n=1 Tax=Fusobacterium nucleatum subsp. polymorphum TaxID=76857 RepID=UPI003007FE7E